MQTEAEIKEFIKNFWKNLLGKEPEKKFGVAWATPKCYNCDSEDIIEKPSPAWTAKFHCNSCGYYSYVVYCDRMGGVCEDSVAIDKESLQINTD